MAGFDSFLDKAQSIFEAATAYLSDPNWTQTESEDNFTLSRQTSDTGIDSIKIDYCLDANPRTFGRNVFENFLTYIPQVAGQTLEFINLVEQYNPDAMTTHSRIKGLAEVSSRELSLFNIWVDLSETSFALIITSVDNPKVTFSPDAVPAELEYELHYFEAIDGDLTKTHYTFATKFDPKGSVPATLANTRISETGVEIKGLIDLALKNI